ncbi:MAG: protein translocase subunit SecD [Pseudomonadales bacterium]|nr:protein translocase subunit SecD [Pseudomonadales bacterium]
MINKYPLWKNLIVLGAFVLGIIYALPNIYPPDFAVQVSSATSGQIIDNSTLTHAKDALDSANISYFRPELDKTHLLIRFNDAASQRQAKGIIERTLFDAPGDYVVALNSAPATPEWLVSMGAKPMKYGLDLRGGVHFLMEVDTEAVINDRLENLETDIKRKLRSEKLRYKQVESTGKGVLNISFTTEDVRDQAHSLLESQYDEFVFSTGELPFPYISLRITTAAVKAMEDFAISQNVQTIRNRVNELGVSEPLVQRLGRNRIVVDLPGVQDTAEAKRILGKVATLEFRLEAKPNAPRSTTVTYPYEGRAAQLERNIVLRGDRVVDAQVGFDPDSGLPQVNITLDSEGGNLMHRSTRNNVGRRLGVLFIETKTKDKYTMVNGEEIKETVPYVVRRVISLATVQSALGVKFRITGLQAGEARELALLLRAGALAADMYIVEERTVGASMGKENVELGARSVAVGLALVLLFMLAYYRVFGLAANLALAGNLVLLVAVMSSIGATLTLPGIAGIVLTVGMAVDANVLIFSRIREELKNGLSPQAAISAGYDRAFTTILDANLTTLIVALILYSIGTGPVKGFAVTLSIGILTSMFTAIMGSRAIINLMYGGRNIKKLAI